MASPKAKLYPKSEAHALMRKAKELGYPMDDPWFYEFATINQLDNMINHNYYDC